MMMECVLPAQVVLSLCSFSIHSRRAVRPLPSQSQRSNTQKPQKIIIIIPISRTTATKTRNGHYHDIFFLIFFQDSSRSHRDAEERREERECRGHQLRHLRGEGRKEMRRRRMGIPQAAIASFFLAAIVLGGHGSEALLQRGK